MHTLAAGSLLIANPHLDDPDFLRTVILLCEYNNDGALGFVLNRPANYQLDDLVMNAQGCALPVFRGGPVTVDSLHFVHRYPTVIGAIEVAPGIYWGGSFPHMVAMLQRGEAVAAGVKFFMGYSGWEAGQLEAEMQDKTWITAPASSGIIFAATEEDGWKKSLKQLGGQYEWLIHAPLNPSMN